MMAMGSTGIPCSRSCGPPPGRLELEALAEMYDQQAAFRDGNGVYWYTLLRELWARQGRDQ